MDKLKILSKKRVFNHPWESIFIEKVKTSTGTVYDYLISYPNDFVIVVPFLSQNKILMVNQYKHGIKKQLLGFPAGFLKERESPIKAAERELMEETGYEFNSFKLVATLSENPTRCRNKYFIVFAKNPKKKYKKIENPDKLEGNIEKIIIGKKDLNKATSLKLIQAGPMLSAIPFIFSEKY